MWRVARTLQAGASLHDARGFIASFAVDPSKASGLTWDLTKNLTGLQTETNAFRITDAIYRSANRSFSTGCQGCTLGVGARTPADRDLAITRILSNPAGRYSPKLNVRQFPEWNEPQEPAKP